MKPPSRGKHPNFITKDGKVIWNEVVKVRKVDIKAAGDLRRQWAAAIVIYKRTCAKNRVMPFKKESYPSAENLKKRSRDDLIATLRLSNKKANKKIEEFFSDLSGHARKLTKQLVKDVEYSDGLYKVILQRRIFLHKDVPISWLNAYLVGKHDFARVNRSVSKSIGAFTNIKVKADPKNKYQALIQIFTTLTKDQVLSIVPKKRELNRKETIRSIFNLFKKWMKAGKLLKRRERVLARFDPRMSLITRLEDKGEFIFAMKVESIFKEIKL